MAFDKPMVSKASHEDKIIMMMPLMLKAIKKALPQIRSPYTAKELMNITVKIANELKLIKTPDLTK